MDSEMTNSDPDTRVTFQALADALIPATPELAANDSEQMYGALNLQIDLYIIWTLDHFLAEQVAIYNIPVRLSAATANMLNAAAMQLLMRGKATATVNYPLYQKGCLFASLNVYDRFKTLELLERVELDLGILPPPYQNNAGMVKQMVDMLNRLTYFGYYSEWSGYMSTRLANPDERILERFPISWIQVGYPGPAYGYRDLRGFLLTFPRHGSV